jgi:zinc-binding alcohol dehydrogenase/oxidoreductase
MTGTMHAVRLHEIAGPEGLRFDEIPVPVPAEGEILIRLRAAALNRRDVFITQGLYPKIRMPVTLGSDGAGEIAALGAGSAGAVGDQVVIDPMLGWGGFPNVWDAENSSILGMPHEGTFAQFVAVPAENVYPKPGRLSMEEAAAIPLAGLTAYRALFTRGALRRGETVLLTGIGGGVATLALLFAKYAGARAIVTSGSDEKLAHARSLGADSCFNYKNVPDWAKAARAEGPIDLVVDSSGAQSLSQALDAVRPGGRIVVYGGTGGDATIKPFPLFWKHVTILGTSMGSPQDFSAMLKLFARSLTPVVDRVFPLRNAAAAFAHLRDTQQFGKVVLRID